MSAVVGPLPQSLQGHPAKRARPGPVEGRDGILCEVGNRRPGSRAGLSVGCHGRVDGVGVGEPEGLLRGLYQARIPTAHADALSNHSRCILCRSNTRS